MNVIIANRQRTRKINLRLLKQIAAALLAELKIEKAELGINLVAAPEMTRLNETFLRHAGSTDVITFDYADDGRAGSPPAAKTGRRTEDAPALHGEIFICVDEAVLQARNFGTTWQSEIVRYIVHGVLHLLGHDDSRAGARRKMKREENRLLRELSRRFSLAQLWRVRLNWPHEKILFRPLARQFFDRLAVILPGVITLAVVKWLFGTISSVTDLLLFFLPGLPDARSLIYQDGSGPMYWYWSLVALVLAVAFDFGGRRAGALLHRQADD